MFIVSIITVVYNSVTEIEKTVASVLDKKTAEVEYIVVDGASTDGTVDVIRKHQESIDAFISEPDKGIYDAMNKGITAASGKYILFINAGDLLVEVPLESIKMEDADMHCFPVFIGGSSVKYPSINWKFKVTNTLPHQGIFYRKNPFLKYDTSYKVFADYALNAEYIKNKKKIQLWQQPTVAHHNLDGVSNNKNSSRELFQLIRDKFGLKQLLISFVYFKLRGLYFRLRLLCF